MAIIKEIWNNFGGRANIESRTFTTRYEVTGLDPTLDVRPQVLPTATSTGIFPTPGTFPGTMPDGRPLIDNPMRVESVRVVSASCGKAIVDVEMASRIASFDSANSYLLDMRITAAVEFVPSNYSIKADGLRDVFAKVRYLFSGTSSGSGSGSGSSSPYERIAQLNVPQNRKCVTIVRSESASLGGITHFNKASKCAFTNSTDFWGSPARTWLCTALESSWTGFYDRPWQTNYQFVYNPNQWTGVAYFEDQSLKIPMKNITPPANFDPGTESASPYGCKVFRIAGEHDFTTFGLPDITTAG